MTVATPRLSVGVITADLTRLGSELEILRGKAAWAHIDVMDGAFCPQLTVGPVFVAAAVSAGIPVDVHLMITEPRRLLPEIAAAGASVITVHAEATTHLHRTMQEMTELAGQPPGFLRGVAINPGTPVQAIEPVLELADLILILAVNPGWPGQAPAASTRRRVEAVRALADRCGSPVLIGVDGGVTIANAAQIAGWGVDVIVSGSAVFDRVSPARNLELLTRELLRPVPPPAPATPVPAISVPAISVPAISVPAISVPAIPVPAISAVAAPVPAACAAGLPEAGQAAAGSLQEVSGGTQ